MRIGMDFGTTNSGSRPLRRRTSASGGSPNRTFMLRWQQLLLVDLGLSMTLTKSDFEKYRANEVLARTRWPCMVDIFSYLSTMWGRMQNDILIDAGDETGAALFRAYLLALTSPYLDFDKP